MLGLLVKCLVLILPTFNGMRPSHAVRVRPSFFQYVRNMTSSDGSREEGGIEMGSNVLILSGKYKTCTGSVVKLKSTKAKVKRSCPEGDLEKGDGKTWWYKIANQIELIEEESAPADIAVPEAIVEAPQPIAEAPQAIVAPEEEIKTPPAEDIAEEIAGANTEEQPAAEIAVTWEMSLVKDADFRKKHPLCENYADIEPLNPEATPPKLGSRVVVRRGADFQVAVSSVGEPKPTVHLRVFFLASLPGVPEEVADVTGVEINPAPDGDLFDVSFPWDAPIGEYELRVFDGSSGQPLKSLGIIVTFNPFSCRKCPEYVSSSKLKKDFLSEYVGGEEGLIWQGLSDDNGGQVWSFEPFRAANLLISLSLLADLPLNTRSDPTLLSRHLSFAIGDRVCHGKWGGGSYTTGKPSGGYKCRSKKWLERKKNRNKSLWSATCKDPSDWTGSSPILEQHWGLLQAKQESTSVQYCQCFVFAGVTTTVGRSLGLGTRPVTNFQSAHDVSRDRSISKYYFIQPSGAWDAADDMDLCPGWCNADEDAKERGCDRKTCADELRLGTGFESKPSCATCMPCVPCASSHDSIWSFHVWNEMYFDRLDMKKANGWQAVDATPQEESGGMYRMGPASLRKVKKGESACFDNDFVISEVNADVKLFAYALPEASDSAKEAAVAGGSFQLHAGDPLLYGTRFESDPFEDSFNTIGYQLMTKAPGPISDECRKDYQACNKNDALDVTKLYKRCNSEASGGRSCGAGVSDPNGQLQCDKNESATPSLVQTYAAVDFNARNETQLADSRSGPRLANKLSEVHAAGDVTAKFEAFLPEGPVSVDEPLDIRVVFKSTAKEPRTINVLLSITACDYRGVPIVFMVTRAKKHVSRVPLLKYGEATELDKKVEVPAGGRGVFKHTVTTGLTVDRLAALEIESNGFLQFHFSAAVEETGQVFSHEPRKRIAE